MIYNTKSILNEINKKRDENQKIGTEDQLVDLVKKGFLLEDDIKEVFSKLRLQLGEHLKLDNVSFLTGNGCSIYAGSKSTMDFKISDTVKEDGYKNIADVIKHIQGLGMEKQLDALLTIQKYYQLTKDKREAITGNLIDALKKNLIENYVNSVNYDSLGYHEAMFRRLRAFGCLNKTRFYTLNYDMAFEYVMDKLSIPYSNGFTGFVNRRFDPKSLKNNKMTGLVKLHGSVNWIYDSDSGDIKEVQPKFDGGKTTVPDAEHALIYPTVDKLFQTYNLPYSELMREMLDSFESSRNVIIVLGYKYGDEHINEILYKALANPNNIFYFFYYGNDDCQFIDKMKAISDQTPNINIFTGKFLPDFTNFVRYMLPAMPEKTDEERAIELWQKVLVKHD